MQLRREYAIARKRELYVGGLLTSLVLSNTINSLSRHVILNMDHLKKPKIVNIIVQGNLEIPLVFEKLIGCDNINGPFEDRPSHLQIIIKPRPVLITRNGFYTVFGLRSRAEVKEVMQNLEQFLKGVGLLK